MTRFFNERQDCEGNINDVNFFNDLIRALGLIDIPFGGRFFTWSNKRATPAFAKFDRFLVSETWDDTFLLSTGKTLPNTLSDHTLISLFTSSTHQLANRFYFKSM